ncbi:MAG: hypothetical protein IPK82_21975 [Polyangiaceae bacterium]|nr:hypothetical protein [Polyangiaceae bacterium]
MTSPTESEPPGQSNDPEIDAFAKQLQSGKGALPTLLLPMDEAQKNRVIERARSRTSGAAVVRPNVAFWRRKWPVAASTFALAAGILLYIAVRNPSDSYPHYALEVTGDVAVRSVNTPQNGPIHLRPSTRFVARLKPEMVGQPAALRMLLVRDGKAAVVPVAYRVESGGVLIVDGLAKEVLGNQANGPARLVFVVGPTLPPDTDLTVLATQPSNTGAAGVAILHSEVVLEGWETASRSLDLPDIELAGCIRILTNGTCEITPQTTLNLWVPFHNVQPVSGGMGSAIIKKI